MKNKKHDGKHLTISQRIIIEKGLGDHESFKAIATRIGKDPTTVAKEVKNHIFESVKSDKYGDIPCQYSLNCKIKGLCADSCCKTCKTCTKPHVRCKDICPKYTEKTCGKLDKAPYVCNGCYRKGSCNLRRKFYSAKYAHDSYSENLVSSREGINQNPVDIYMLDQLISPLLKKGQSLAHIYANHASEIPCSRKTLYNYIDKGLFEARNIDMRRRVRYKVRKKRTCVSFSAREYRIGRTYDDYCKIYNKNVGLRQNKNVGKPTFLFCILGHIDTLLLEVFQYENQFTRRVNHHGQFRG